MTSSYYLWRWAANDLPGQPSEVFSDLLHGRMHPALQSFDALPVLQKLRETAAARQAVGEEWDWKIQPADTPDCASFVFLQCPTIPRRGEFRKLFINLMYPWDLSGYDEQEGTLIECLLPKLNGFESGQQPGEDQFDISEADLPVLLGRLHPAQADPWAIFTDHRNHFVECYAHADGFDVEWRANRSLTDFTDYDHWRAGYRVHRAAGRGARFKRECRMIDSELRAVKIQQFRHERLRFSDTLRIFQTFLREGPRPVAYQWRSIRKELERETQHRRKLANHD